MRLLYSFLLCLTLAACAASDVKDTLGLTRKAPDEFRVLARPPLSVPPEFALRPPADGEEYSSGLPAHEQAKSRILGTSDQMINTNNSVVSPNAAKTTGPDTSISSVASSDLATTGDAQFLSNAGAAKANPNIRTTIANDKGEILAPADNSYFFGGKQEDAGVIDPGKEAQRLKDNKAQNKPVTEGATPTIKPKDKGILGDIF